MNRDRNRVLLLGCTVAAAFSPLLPFSYIVLFHFDSSGEATPFIDKLYYIPFSYLFACIMMGPFTLSFFFIHFLAIYLLLIRTIIKVRFSILSQLCFFIMTYTLAVFPGTIWGWAFYDQEFYVFYWALISTSACYGVLLAVAIIRGFPRGKTEAGEKSFKIEPLR